LRSMVDIADSEGTFNEAESNRIKGVLDFYNLDIKDVLKTPRVDIIALPSDASFEEVREVAIQNPFSRYTVYDKDIEDNVTVFHSKYLYSLSMNHLKTYNSFIYSVPLYVF